MSKLNLISNLEEETKTPKRKFQVFEAEIGFEKVEVRVPVELAEAFEKEALQQRPKSAARLRSIAKKFEGVVE